MNGLETNDIGKWDGKHWSSLGEGLNGGVNSIEVFDDGTGEALFVGGSLWRAEEVATRGIAKWDGYEWLEVGDRRLAGPMAWVYDLAVRRSSSGSNTLFLAGPFVGADPEPLYPASRLIEWRGCARPSLSVSPSCPLGGRIILVWTNATPGGQVAILVATHVGAFAVPGGRTRSGTRLGLDSRQLQVVFAGPAGESGSRTLNANTGPNACGRYLQLLDVDSCRTSEAVLVE